MLGLVYLLFVYMQLDETSGWAFAIVAASTSAIGAVLSWRLGPAVGLAVASFLAVPPEEIRYWNDHSIGNLGEVVLFLGTLFISHEYLRSIDRGNQLVSALYVYSGAKSIVARLRHRRAGDEGLPTGVLWLLGVYSAVYGLASQRYDGRVADIESRSTAVFSKISTRGDTGTRAFALVPGLQHMRCPVKPVFWPPNHTPLQSILADTLLESNVVEWAQTVELWKDSLVDVDFGSIATLRQDSTLYSLTNPLLMHNRDLRGANLTRARLVGADLRYSNLTGATTDGTDFSFTNFSGVRIGDKVYADPTVCAIRSIGTCRPDTSLSTINWAELTTGSLPEDLNFVTY